MNVLLFLIKVETKGFNLLFWPWFLFLYFLIVGYFMHNLYLFEFARLHRGRRWFIEFIHYCVLKQKKIFLILFSTFLFTFLYLYLLFKVFSPWLWGALSFIRLLLILLIRIPFVLCTFSLKQKLFEILTFWFSAYMQGWFSCCEFCLYSAVIKLWHVFIYFLEIVISQHLLLNSLLIFILQGRIHALYVYYNKINY